MAADNRGRQSLAGTPAIEEEGYHMQAIEAKPGNDIKNAPPETASPRLTCSLQEAAALTGWPLPGPRQPPADLTGLSYDYLHGQSKIANPSERLPGFKTGKSVYRVIVSELPGWLLRKAGIA